MADISKLARVISGEVRNVDISNNTPVVLSLKVGTATPTELTKVILDRLISLQNGSDVDATYHTHDGRYFTETELGSATSSSGSDLIGDDDTYSNFTPAAATVKGALSGIDAALAGVGGAEFSDAMFRVYDDGDATKELAFEVSGIATATTRTITMPDANINLADVNNAVLVNGSRAFTAAQSMGGFKLTNLANGTVSGDAVNYAQLTALSSMIQNFEWQESVLDKDIVTPPGAPATGDRYLIGLDQGGGVATGDWTGRDGDIAEWDGAAWIFTEPTLGTYVSVDDEDDGLYLFGGTLWTKKFFEATTASTGLTKVGFDIRLDASSAGAGLGFASGVLSVNVDDSTIEISTDTLQVKDGGITSAKLNASVAGAGLTGGGGSALAVGAGDGISVAADAVAVSVAALAGTGLEDDGSNNLRIAAAAAGAGLTGGAGAALSVVYSPLVQKNVVVGESFAANTSFLVRMAVSGESAGRVYKADNDATTLQNHYVYGIVHSGSALSAGNTAVMVMLGSHVLGSSDTPFSSGDIGKPVYLGATGAFTITAPSADNLAAVKVAVVETTTSMLFGNVQLMGIN